MWEDIKERLADKYVAWGQLEKQQMERLLADAEALLKFKREIEAGRLIEASYESSAEYNASLVNTIAASIQYSWDRLPAHLRKQGEGRE